MLLLEEFSKKALLEALDISKEMGFKTKNIQNAIGYAEYGGGEDYVGIIGHVELSQLMKRGWITPPFKMDIRDGRLYGRGVLDNKVSYNILSICIKNSKRS